MTSTDGEWPPYDGFGSKDHLHAIGMIAAIWTSIERRYQAFIQLLFPTNVKAAVKIFELLGNEGRWGLIHDELAPTLPPVEADLVEYFLKCAAICKENRNAVMHAHIFIVEDPNNIGMNKLSSGTGITKQYQFDISAIRAIADDAHNTQQFGLNLWASISLRMSNEFWAQQGTQPQAFLPLPRKPVQPRKWDLRSLKHQSDDQLQPEPPPKLSRKGRKGQPRAPRR
jgi:hypothetical protein